MTETQTEVVGFQYPNGYLPYRGGMLVVYGHNGAGKSLLLESIESSLTGRLVGRTQPNGVDHYGVISSAAVVRGDVELMANEDGPGYNSVDALMRALESADGDIRMLGLPKPVWDGWRGLYQDLYRRVFVVLAPTESDDVRWHGYLAADPSGAASETWDSELASYIKTFAKGDPDDDGYNAWGNFGDESYGVESCVTNLNGVAGDGGIYKFNRATVPVEYGPLGRVITDQSADPAVAVAEVVESAWRALKYDESDGDVADALLECLAVLASEWTDRANRLLADFLLSPPPLRLAIGNAAGWARGVPPRWESASGAEIGYLSFVENRWARIAIALSAPDRFRYFVWPGKDDTSAFPIDPGSSLPAMFLLLDEPERGLHRAAESHLASGLRGLVHSGRVKPILATHSADLLDGTDAQVLRITKQEGSWIGRLDELTAADVDELQAVGLQPSSLLNLDRGYLLVEGVHDKSILEGWFADDLRSMRVAVLPMHGTNNLLTVFDSEFLIERTEALLMPLLDDVALDPLFELWSQTEAKVVEGRRSDAFNLIMRGMGGIRGGAKDYGPLLAGTITRGVSERFFPLGMSKKDVLEYLPIEALVDGATSWSDLWNEWKRSPAAMGSRPGPGAGKAYKDWLRRKGVDLSPENLRLVAETTAPHPELKAIIAKVSARLG